MADVRERIEHLPEAIEAAIDARQAEMWTAVPVMVESYDSAKGTIVAQPTVKSTIRKSDGKLERVQLPLLQDCPVQFPGGGGHTMTFPIKKGDECIAIISNRSIDQWHQSGGVQQQTSARMHDLSDAMIIPGIRSQPRKLTNVSTNSVQLRTDDGKSFVEISDDGGVRMAREGSKVEVDKDGNIRHVPKAGAKLYMG